MSNYISIEEMLKNLGFTNKHRVCKTNNIIEMMKDKNIVLYDYYFTHDGYDEYGPQSDLYDIFVVTYEDNQYIFNEFHFEKWHDSLEEIELIKSFVLNKETLQVIKRYSSIPQNDDGKEFLKNMKCLIKNNSA